jgi:hypothetical protein
MHVSMVLFRQAIDSGEALMHLLHRNQSWLPLKDRRLFVATHSSDVLRELLDSGSGDVRVLRLTREGSNTAVRLLVNSRIQDL